MAPKLRDKGILCYISFGVAVYLFLVISLVHLTHTCRLNLLTNQDELELVFPGANSKGTEADKPCLACMFLTYLKASAFAAFLFTLCIVLSAKTPLSEIPGYIFLFCLSGHIRGPPVFFSYPCIQGR
jgi:hypothetical protein